MLLCDNNDGDAHNAWEWVGYDDNEDWVGVARACGDWVAISSPVAAGRGRGKAAAPGSTLQGRHLRGRKFGILSFHCNVLS